MNILSGIVVGAGVALLVAPSAVWAGKKTCLTGTDPEVANDADQIKAVRALIKEACPCENFDGSPGKAKGDYGKCTKGVINAEAAAARLRTPCKGTVGKYYKDATCGLNPMLHSVPCVERNLKNSKVACKIKATTKKDGKTLDRKCASKEGKSTAALCGSHTLCIDAADTNRDLRIVGPGDTGACRATCGNNKVEAGEACDPAGSACDNGGTCGVLCQCADPPGAPTRTPTPTKTRVVSLPFAPTPTPDTGCCEFFGVCLSEAFGEGPMTEAYCEEDIRGNYEPGGTCTNCPAGDCSVCSGPQDGDCYGMCTNVVPPPRAPSVPTPTPPIGCCQFAGACVSGYVTGEGTIPITNFVCHTVVEGGGDFLPGGYCSACPGGNCNQCPGGICAGSCQLSIPPTAVPGTATPTPPLGCCEAGGHCLSGTIQYQGNNVLVNQATCQAAAQQFFGGQANFTAGGYCSSCPGGNCSSCGPFDCAGSCQAQPAPTQPPAATGCCLLDTAGEDFDNYCASGTTQAQCEGGQVLRPTEFIPGSFCSGYPGGVYSSWVGGPACYHYGADVIGCPGVCQQSIAPPYTPTPAPAAVCGNGIREGVVAGLGAGNEDCDCGGDNPTCAGVDPLAHPEQLAQPNPLVVGGVAFTPRCLNCKYEYCPANSQSDPNVSCVCTRGYKQQGAGPYCVASGCNPASDPLCLTACPAGEVCINKAEPGYVNLCVNAAAVTGCFASDTCCGVNNDCLALPALGTHELCIPGPAGP